MTSPLSGIVYVERPWRKDPTTDSADGDIYAAAPEERARTVQAAYDAGIRLFLAAHEREAASLASSLQVLGLRDKILLATTDGDALDRCPDTEEGGAAAMAAAITRKCELLRTDVIDLFMLYDFRPESHTPARLAGAVRALNVARAHGTVKMAGATCYAAYDALADALSGGLALDVVVSRYNYLDQRATERLFPACRAHGVTVLATQAFSWLGGVPFVRFPNTWRYRNLTQNFYGFSAGQAHLYWILHNPAVDGVAISMQAPQQVAENVAAMHIRSAPTGLEALFDSFAEALTRTREGWRGLLQDEHWEIRTAAERYLESRPRA